MLPRMFKATCCGFMVSALLAGCGDGASTVAAANGPPSRPLKTGQTSCSNIGVSTVSCAGSGQDGETQTGVARHYMDNGDGTITDASTGLMWEKKDWSGGIHDRDTIYLWRDVFAGFIAGLNSARFAGHSDWRLPNINELQSLVDFGASDPAIDAAFNTNCTIGCTLTTCSCTAANEYWSSTSIFNSEQGAWSVVFDQGGVNFGIKSSNGYYVRGVRGGL